MSLKREGERGAYYALVHGTWICKMTIGILTLIQKTCTDWHGSTDELDKYCVVLCLRKSK